MPKNDGRKNSFNSLLASLLLSFSLFFFIPVKIYITNSSEFDFMFPGLLVFLLLAAGAITVLLCLLLTLLPNRFSLRQRAQNLIFSLGFLFFIQSNILVWRYGLLDGRQISWDKMLALGLIDGAVWLAVLVWAQLKLNRASRFLKGAAWVLILLQLFFCAYYYFNSPPFPNFSQYTFSTSKQFDFSSRKNAIILVLDCLQSDLFQEVINEDGSLKETFSGFTYFRNNLGGFPTTYASVPLILTGKYYDNSRPIQDFIKESFLSPSSLPLVLTRNGCRVDLFPAGRKVVYSDPHLAANIIRRLYPFFWSELGYLMDISLFRALPHFGKRLVYNEQKWFVKNLMPREPFTWFKTTRRKGDSPKAPPRKRGPAAVHQRKKWRVGGINLCRDHVPPGSRVIPDVNFMYRALMTSTAETSAPVFKYFHLMGVHSPFRMNEDLQPEILAYTRANWKKLIRGELKLVKLFFLMLKNVGAFDNSLIIVMADHGHPRGDLGRVLPPDLSSQDATNAEIPAGVVEAGLPLLLAKPIGASGDMRISDAPVSNSDIAKTVFSQMHISADCPGESIFHVPEGVSRPRRFYYYTWTLNDWKTDFLPPFTEYRVEGHSWLSQSWQATGRVLRQP
jgi:hypothetical protein